MNLSKLDKKNNPRPYLQDYYNVKKFHATSASRVTTATSRILNKLIDALNKNDRMPKYIIFLLDKDIIGDLKSIEYGATKNLANIVNWLARQCDILIH